MPPGKLDALTKEMIALAVSATNGCYCINSHTAAVKKLGLDDEGLGELMAVVATFNATTLWPKATESRPTCFPARNNRRRASAASGKVARRQTVAGDFPHPLGFSGLRARRDYNRRFARTPDFAGPLYRHIQPSTGGTAHMDPFWILLIGMVIVVGGILMFRLHAFLALTLAALVVGWLTPADAVKWFRRVEAAGFVTQSAESESGEVLFTPAKGQSPLPGETVFVFSADPAERQTKPIGNLRVIRREKQTIDGKSRDVVVARIEEGQAEVRDRTVSRSTWVAAEKAASQTVPSMVAAGFGETCGKIGILIAMAAIIGKCLSKAAPPTASSARPSDCSATRVRWRS